MELSKEEQFLMKEYESAATLTFHIDNLRNTVTGFFLTFAGLAAGGLALLLKGEAKLDIGVPLHVLIATLFIFLSVLGVASIMILAKLRGVQLEHFRIINNVRKYFLGTSSELWDVVQLSDLTLPTETRRSGTYYWMVMIMLVTALFSAGALYLILLKILSGTHPRIATLISAVVFMAVVLLEDQLYLRGAKARPAIRYGSAEKMSGSMVRSS